MTLRITWRIRIVVWKAIAISRLREEGDTVAIIACIPA